MGILDFLNPKKSGYEPHPDDPPALLKRCPACNADVGSWCGGAGDVHKERE
jgi:hypothetical protein